MKFKYRFLFPLIMIVILASCKKNSSPNPASDVDIYAAGSINDVAAYWKNGVAVLMPQPGSIRSLGKAIAVNGNDVYVTGTTTNSQYLEQATCWKNGTATILTDSGRTSMARAIAIKGNDVYIAGYSTGADNNQYATYWRNGVKTVVGSRNSQANAIVINGSDIYVAGFVFVYLDPYSGNQWAAIWKNGTLTKLNSNYCFDINAIAFNGNDFNAAGNVVYWKNGVETYLQTEPGDIYITSIAIAGGDVYLGGISNYVSKGIFYGDFLTYWKNGVRTTLGSPLNIEVNGIAVKDQDIYIAGTLDLSATIWKNGTPATLSPNSKATCITLVSK